MKPDDGEQAADWRAMKARMHCIKAGDLLPDGADVVIIDAADYAGFMLFHEALRQHFVGTRGGASVYVVASDRRLMEVDGPNVVAEPAESKPEAFPANALRGGDGVPR